MQSKGRITKKQFKRFCRQMVADVGDGMTEEKRDRYKSVLLNLANEKKAENEFRKTAANKNRLIQWIGTIAALMLFTSPLTYALWPKNIEMRFWIGEQGNVGRLGEEIATSNNAVIPLHFEKGARIEIQQSSSARVAKATHESVSINLQNGRVAADVHGDGKTRWTVNAGPFKVTVLGTRFNVSWSADKGVFDVEVERGAVLVRGTKISKHGIEVSAGSHLRAIEGTGYLAINSTESKLYNPNVVGLIAPTPTIPINNADKNIETKKSNQPSSEGLTKLMPFEKPGIVSRVQTKPDVSRVAMDQARQRNAGNVNSRRGNNGHRDEKHYSTADVREVGVARARNVSALSRSRIDASSTPRVGYNGKEKQSRGLVSTSASQRKGLRQKNLELESEGRRPVTASTNSIFRNTGAVVSPDNRMTFDKPETVEKTPQNETDENDVWLSYFDSQQYKKAFKAIETVGIDHLIRTLDSDNLWKLIRTARFAGEDDVAEEALLSCRKRFSTTSKARRAAYFLGKLSDDNDRDLEKASRWYETYLRENDSGRFIEEVLGRLMKLHYRKKNHGDAKQRATQYLKKFPNGTFSNTARDILNQ